jgi:hypothetical protein
MELFRFKPANQFVEMHHNSVNYRLNMEDINFNNFYKISK